MQALRTDLKDGYIARYEGGKFRIAADGRLVAVGDDRA